MCVCVFFLRVTHSENGYWHWIVTDGDGGSFKFRLSLALDIRVRVVSVVFNPIIDRQIASAASDALSTATATTTSTTTILPSLSANIIARMTPATLTKLSSYKLLFVVVVVS